MHLGILATTDRHLGQLVGIARAALSAGHAVTVFLTDAATRFLADPRLAALGEHPGVTISFCALSRERHRAARPDPAAAIKEGGQFENALMHAEADRVIAL